MVGFALPQFGRSAYQDIARFASAAEQLGADSFWVGDRLLAPLHPTAGIAGTDSFPEEFGTSLDPLIALTVAATATTTARLGTNVLVAPWYSPLLLARQLTTIDVISRGRLLAGFGIGFSPEEFEAAGVPFENRGARLDELIEVLDAAWTANPVEHHGKLWTIPESWIDLKPVQRPRPPLYLGAFSPAGLRRIGERGDGWLAVQHLAGATGDVGALSGHRATIDDAASAVGRDPLSVCTIVRVNVAAGTEIDRVAEAVRMLAESGYGDVFIDLMNVVTDIDTHLEWVRQLLAGGL